MGRMIGIFSGKGGTGKTTCALNLGMAMHGFGENVMVMDCNLRNSNLALYMGIYDTSSTLHDVLESDISLLESIHIHNSGLRFIPSSIPIRYVTSDISKLRAKLDEMDYTIIMDTPPGIGEDVISMLRLTDDIIVITNPEIPSITDTLKLIQLALDMDKHVTGVIVNRVSGKNEVSLEHITKVCRAPIIGVVPEDRGMKKALHERNPVLLSRPFSPASLAFKNLASKMSGREYRQPAFARLRNMF